MPAERLQKVLAAAGVASRRGAESMIAAGRVTVDGRVATLGTQADPDRSIIAVDGRVIGRTARDDEDAGDLIGLHRNPAR